MLKGRPYSEYELYVDMDRAKGIGIGNTYLNRMSAMEFSYAIAAVEVEKFRELFSRTKFFSLMCDESTDVYNLEQVIAYIRFSIRGKVYTKFLGLESVIRANAEQITNVLFKMLSKTLCWVPPVDVIKPVEVSDVFMHIEGDENNIIETVDENLIHYRDGLRNTEERIELVEDVETIDGDDKIESLFGSINEGESSDDEMIELVNKETGTTLVLEKLSDRDECVPLLSGFTSDGASVLTGQKSGVNVKLRQKCNYFMLNGHCMSRRVQLALKDTDKKCKQFKDLFEFLEQLFVFHKTSNVVTNVFRESVRDLDIKCAFSVIRVNGTRWVNHVHNALTNIFNSLKAHIAAYESLKLKDDYSKPQKEKATFFLKRLNSPAWISFALFTLDVLEMLSCISWISQKKNIGIHEIEDSIQHAVGRLEKFLQNPDTGKRFKTRELFGASDIGVRLHFVKKLKEDLQQRCGSDFPPVFAEATCLLNAPAWKFDNFFRAVDSSGKLYSQYIT